ncbi:MAG: maleylacetoacetate isomerase [Betaproteobacteria bacterium]|jgi:maleylacetoacetate isomerase|nr:maleylacetoacetate isomerase [Betaproteobacteria bacterium]
MKMYGFWRSLAAYRVRVALKLKGIDYEEEGVNLLAGEQHDPAYLKINPQGAVPALILDDGTILSQSMAILEWLEETYPRQNPLLPTTPNNRARVRSLCHIAVSDSHPLVVPRIRSYLSKDLALGDATTAKWLNHWSDRSLAIFNDRLTQESQTGRYCHGDAVSIADICLASQVVGATGFFGCSLEPYPKVKQIFESLMQIAAFEKSLPKHQPGAPAPAA